MLGFDALGRLALGQLPVATSTPANEDSWHQPFSTDIVRRRSPMHTGAQQFASFVQFAPFGENIKVTEWFIPFSEPVRFRPRLATTLQQFASFTQFQIRLDSWFVPFNEPTRFSKRLPPSSQQFASFVQFAPFYEAVSADRWFIPFSEPTRFRRQLPTSEQWFGRGIEFPLTTVHLVFGASLLGEASLGGLPTSNYKMFLSDRKKRLIYTAEISPWTVSDRNS
jgi:hypothetical protein